MADKRRERNPAAGGNGARRPQAGKTVQAVPVSKKKKVKYFYDYSLLFAVIFITAFGLIMIYSSSQYMAMLKGLKADYYFTRQLIIAVAGLIGAIIISKLNYRLFRMKLFVYGGYAASVILLVATKIVGVDSHGRTRWLEIAGVSFQPTEIAKAAIILWVAWYISKTGLRINEPKKEGQRIGHIAKIYLCTLPLAILIASENLSSGIIIVGIVTVMVFVAYRNSKPFYILGIIGVICYIFRYRVVGVIEFLGDTTGLIQPYQMERILSWLYPEKYDAYQTMQGLYAIGSGGLTGQGLGESLQKLGPLPEVHNDMIFTVICEELGLFGAISVILIFLFIIYRCMLIASNAPDLFGSFIAIGVMAHISIQVVLNIAVVTNSIPNTGVTLPFISYGGTAVLLLMAEIGLVLGVSNKIRLDG